MLYRALGLMSGSSLDGLDIVFAEFHENGGSWEWSVLAADCYVYPEEWPRKLQAAAGLPARDYLLLHSEYGHYLGKEVNRFITQNQLEYQVALIASHGHTVFHVPPQMTAQLGDGAAIAAETRLPVVSDLRALDLAFGGQGAPIVPIGEKLLLPGYDFYLNIGGIANISANGEPYIAFDICPANRVLNLLARDEGKEFDESGKRAAEGSVHAGLLEDLNGLSYYQERHPKSLDNSFGVDIIYPLITRHALTIPDALRTYAEHIAIQVRQSLSTFPSAPQAGARKLLVTGGGAFNRFLVSRISDLIAGYKIEVVVPDEKLVKYKEAIIMALLGVLRWRESYTTLSSVTGASRSSIGGALWNGQEA